MLQIIGMILIVGFFAKMSNRPGMPLWVIYLFKSITLLLFLYIIFILVANIAGVQISAIVTSIAGGISIALLIFNYKKFVQKKADAQKLVDEIGKDV
jgi:positive regulator of sigma E activity